MAEYSSILRLLEAERERYILEAAELERRLQFVRNQMSSLDNLISGYSIEEQMYSTSGRLSNLHSPQAFLQQNLAEKDEDDFADEYIETESLLEENTAITNSVISEEISPITNSKPTVTAEDESRDFSTLEIDISDIPKLGTKRKPTSLPLLPEFQDYSVQNAILILMRRRPDLHMHIDAITRDIYGDLPPEQMKVAKMNVSKALSTGSVQRMWYRVLRATGVYTLHYEKGVTAKA